ncbi:phage integrase SAM-like domain-containing protein [Flavobacterium sp. LB2P84]|uniref:site-specific integrase n=1 Tax=Flavobacterium yafengii TaxID=3041253 RepID=UPI0024A9C1C2|nr:site-specific integrase [Flavobacterium yafengii]MDI6033120.1 phage integrase SAM-like domain-containing protein [Flavobacterium yafengii]
MATVNYKIDDKAKKDPTKIYVRFKDGVLDIETPTSIIVFKKHWSSSKQKVKPLAEADEYRDKINTQLTELKAKIYSQYNLDQHRGIKINTQWLKNVILIYDNKHTSTATDVEIFLTTFGDFYCNKSKERINPKTGKKLDNRTYLDLQNSVNKVKDYESTLATGPIRLDEVTIVFHKHFTDYLRTTEKLGENTIGGIIDNIVAMLKDAKKCGYIVCQDYKSKEFISPSAKTTDIYFNESEINKIKNYQFELDGYLDNARDWLIIGLWTGLRISDFLQLKKEDYNDGFIQNNNFKTGIPVIIPIHPDVQEILDKRTGELPREISDQNFNIYIKKVAEKVGITETIDGSKMKMVEKEDKTKVSRKVFGKYQKFELVTSHICRRSFATNLYGKIDTLTIMKITGHKTEKQFLDYVKITSKEYAIRLKQLWAKIYEKQNPVN